MVLIIEWNKECTNTPLGEETCTKNMVLSSKMRRGWRRPIFFFPAYWLVLLAEKTFMHEKYDIIVYWGNKKVIRWAIMGCWYNVWLIKNKSAFQTNKCDKV